MISGMYMGEIVRLCLEKLKKHGLLFGGRGSEELSTMGRFYTKYVSEIERLVPHSSQKIQCSPFKTHLVITTCVKVFRVNPEFRILRLTF